MTENEILFSILILTVAFICTGIISYYAGLKEGIRSILIPAESVE